MTNRTSLTGGVVLDFQYREVWEDQVDNYADDCPMCGLVDAQISCNVYLSFTDGERHLQGACRCCILHVAMFYVHRLDRNRPVIVEFARQASDGGRSFPA